MCRHIYDWNIVNCDVKQQIQLNSIRLYRVLILFLYEVVPPPCANNFRYMESV